MTRAKLFMNGRSQAVRLPKECQFSGKEVIVQKHGDIVILVPADKIWETFLHGISSFSEDFMQDGRDQGIAQDRDFSDVFT